MSATTHFASEAVAEPSVEERFRRIERLTDWLDTSLTVPGFGIRIGWDTIIGLVPGIGDIVTGCLSVWIINEARRLGVSRFLLTRMAANTGIDALIGSVPVAGDVFDAAFKANLKNVRLLRKALEKRGQLIPAADVT